MSWNEDRLGISVKQIAEECIAVRLRILNRAVTRLYNQALRPHGLTISQMNILVAVSCLRKASQQDICRVLDLEKSTLSRDVERMRTEGWLSTRSGPDGRSSVVSVTQVGKKLIERVTPAWQGAQQQASALLGKKAVSSLSRTVGSLSPPKSSEP